MESCVTWGCHRVNILAQSLYNLIYKWMNLIPVRSLADWGSVTLFPWAA